MQPDYSPYSINQKVQFSLNQDKGNINLPCKVTSISYVSLITAGKL